MDVFDKATEIEEKLRDAALANHKVAPRLKPVGICLNCDDPVGPEALFCHTSCREDYEVWQRQQSRTRAFSGE